MARAFWKGVISFGMVAIPVKMYVATESHTTSFHILHKKCLSRLKQMWFCPTDNEYLPLQETVRGYEYAPANTWYWKRVISRRSRSRPCIPSASTVL